MCGRIANTLPVDAMAQLFSATPGNDLPSGARLNICPTQPLAVCTAQDGARHLETMRWGFLPHWYDSPTAGPLLINARAETVAEKPAFRAAIRTRRCLIPADGFYEWHRAAGAKLPYYISRRDGQPMVFGGLWQDWEHDGQRLRSVAMVTVAAGPTLEPIHHREPLILEPEDWSKWLGEDGRGAALLMHPCAQGVLQAWRVDPKVNSNRAEGEDLRAPLADPT
ncbi:SOS response-associated peptidase [uncultured Thioclava sp.]|uniref:SOS response-associated peptidase n=1 Tax=uncultured Thioclava sp. TaxID=473858 RepID=UPI0025EB2BFA|nr:SOS response-associated peptidase [uncultured Thioclava sp.]